VLGLEYATYKYDWIAAREQLDAALATDSRDAVALYLNAWLAFDLGLYDQAVRLQNISVSIDPLSPDAHQNGAIIDYLMGNLDSAERSFRISMAIGPTWAGNHVYLGQIELRRGRPEAALKEILAERSSARDYGLAIAYDALGRRAESDAALDRLMRKQQSSPACNIAIVYAARGDREQAFKWLGRAVDQRDLTLGHKFRNDPWLVQLRGDPRYHALLRRMNLPD
jgi:tetratricopeptide (TPR) repeat protein